MDFLPTFPTLFAFTAASLLLAMTPGPDMTLSISRALSQGRGPALYVVVGTSLVILGADKLAAWLQRNPKVLRGIDYTFAGVFSVFAAKILLTQAR